MNSQTSKSFAIKLALASIGAAVAWHVVVGSQVDEVRDLRHDLEQQNKEIEVGQEAINQFSGSMQSSIKQMSEIKDTIATQFDLDHSVNSHKFLQETAEQAGLTVLRVEPLGAEVNSRELPASSEELVMETEEYRLECVGPYASLAQFLDMINHSANIAKVNTFRLVPLSKDSTRGLLQVSVYQLTKAPEQLTSASPDSATSIGSGVQHGQD
ncbi:MAG: hypothetical protein ACWA5W_05685 [Phycisphaerales bacterium]